MNEKRVLVTGAAGFVGKHLVKLLAERGYYVRAMVRKNSKVSFSNDLNVEVVQADLRIKNNLYSVLNRIDYVVHLATTMKGPWEEYMESTVLGTKRLLEIAKSLNVKKIIYISSIAVYDITGADGKTITEDTPYIKGNYSYYERSKIETEKIVLNFLKNGLPCIIIRPGIIYGPYGALYPSRLGYSLGEHRFVVIGKGNNRIPLVYVENLIDFIYLTLANGNLKNEIFNVLDDQVITQRDYLNKIMEVNPSLSVICIPYFASLILSKLLGSALKIIKKQSPLRNVYLFQCSHQINYSNKKAKTKLGWIPKYEPKAAINHTSEWYKNSKKNHRDVNIKSIKAGLLLKDTMNVGIIGCGWIASTHLSALKKIRNLNVVALCDTNVELAQRLVERFGRSTIYSNFEEMLNKEKLNTVHILTPPQSHRELTIKATQKRCHILVEKPMAMNFFEARDMVEAANRYNVKLCVNHNHLFDPIMIEARRLVKQGSLGNIVYVESWYGLNLGSNLNSRYMLPGAEKHWSMTLPGKLYQNLMPHPISVLTDIIGFPDEIYSITSSGGVVKAMDNDELRVLVKCNETLGLISVSLAVNPRYQFLHIYGTKMSIFLDFLTNTIIKHTTTGMVPKPISRAFMNLSTAKILASSTVQNFWKVLKKTFTPYEGTEILIKKFYMSLTEGTDVPVSGEEGLSSMKIMDKIWSNLSKDRKYERQILESKEKINQVCP